MVKYEDGIGNSLKIKIRSTYLNEYWLSIKLSASPKESKNFYSMYLQTYTLVRNDKIRNNQIIASEGSNQISAYIHQFDPSVKDDEETFIELAKESYFSNDNVSSDFKQIGKKVLDRSSLEKELEVVADEYSINTDLKEVSSLLLPALDEIKEVEGSTDQMLAKKLFEEYEESVNKVLVQIREEVYQKKYPR